VSPSVSISPSVSPSVSPSSGSYSTSENWPRYITSEGEVFIPKGGADLSSLANDVSGALTELEKKADLTETQPVELKTGTAIVGGVKFVDENGTSYGVKHVNNKPRVSSMPYLYDIAEGNVSGHALFQRFGFNDASSTSEETMWSHSSQYVWPTAGSQIRVVSSQAQDVADTGTGAWTVVIEYLKSDFTSGSVTLSMNGTTNVDSGASHADIYRVNSFRIATAGTNNAAIGNITLTQVTGGLVVGYIRAGKTRDRSTIMTVPTGKTLYLTSFSASSVGTKYVTVTLHVGCVLSTGVLLQRGMFYPSSEVLLLNDTYHKELEIPIKIPATCDFKASVTAEAAGSLVSCALRGWME